MNMTQLEQRLKIIELKQKIIDEEQQKINSKLIGEGTIELGGNRLKIDISTSLSELKKSN